MLVMGRASPGRNVLFTGCFTCSLRGIPLAASATSATRIGKLLFNPSNACACDTVKVVCAPTCLIMQRYKMYRQGLLSRCAVGRQGCRSILTCLPHCSCQHLTSSQGYDKVASFAGRHRAFVTLRATAASPAQLSRRPTVRSTYRYSAASIHCLACSLCTLLCQLSG